MSFQCDRCSRCCYTHRVPLTVADVLRLRSTTMGEAEEFVEWMPPDVIDAEPESFFDLQEGRKILMLRHVQSSKTDPSLPNTHCIFLTEHGCRVHEVRPAACRSYPYDRAARGHLTLSPNVACASETDVLGTLHATLGHDRVGMLYENDIAQRDHQLQQHASFVLSHNRRVRLRRRLGKRAWSGAETLERLCSAPPVDP